MDKIKEDSFNGIAMLINLKKNQLIKKESKLTTISVNTSP